MGYHMQWFKTYITKLVQCAKQWIPSKWGDYWTCIWCVTPLHAPCHTTQLGPRNGNNITYIWG
jgi:hypothetical protein